MKLGTSSMKVWIIFSYILVVLVSIASLLGLFHPDTYSLETDNWTLQARGQDIGNLLAVLVLLVSTYTLNKRSAKAFFAWMGTLLYFIYAYLIYAFFVHFNFLFLLYVAILGLSFYSLIVGLLKEDKSFYMKKIVNRKFKFASILLILTGLLFGLLWLSEIIPALISNETPKSIEEAGLWVNPIQVIDLALVLPGMIITGVLLFKKNFMGYLFAAPWLMFSVLMGSSIVATMIMEVSQGNKGAFVPMAMVGVIVTASLGAFFSILKNSKN